MRVLPEGLDPTSRLIALTLLRHGPRSRAELCRELGLSSASLTRLARPMLEAGILAEGEPTAPATTGRPSVPLSLVADAAHFVGVKLVTGQLHLVLTDLSARVLRSTVADVALPTPQAGATTIAEQVARFAGAEPSGIGISLGASVAPDGTVGSADFLGWPASRLGELVASATGLPTVVDNDVNALAVAEHWFGAGRELADFCVITVGMGVGLGLVCNDRIVPGSGGAAGQVGHMLLDEGRASDLLQTAALCRDLSQALGREVAPADLPDVLLEARAQPVLRRTVRALGQLVAQVSLVSAPQAVLVTGEAIGLLLPRAEAVEEAVAELLPEPRPRLVLEELDFSEWARGAACLAIRQLLAD